MEIIDTKRTQKALVAKQWTKIVSVNFVDR